MNKLKKELKIRGLSINPIFLNSIYFDVIHNNSKCEADFIDGLGISFIFPDESLLIKNQSIVNFRKEYLFARRDLGYSIQFRRLSRLKFVNEDTVNYYRLRANSFGASLDINSSPYEVFSFLISYYIKKCKEILSNSPLKI